MWRLFGALDTLGLELACGSQDTQKDSQGNRGRPLGDPLGDPLGRCLGGSPVGPLEDPRPEPSNDKCMLPAACRPPPVHAFILPGVGPGGSSGDLDGVPQANHPGGPPQGIPQGRTSQGLANIIKMTK